MRTWVERALNVHSGDLGRGLLLCACLFLVITCTVVGKVAGAALFLSRFPARQMAWVDISSALLVALIVANYVVIARKVSVVTLVSGSMFLFAANCILFWALARHDAKAVWLFPVFYGWVKIIAVLSATQIWTLANCILTTREAKRIFGLVGSGAILGAVFAGFLAKTTVKALGTESLLVAMTLCYAACGGLVIVTWHIGRAQMKDQPAAATGKRNSGDLSSLRLILGSRYLLSIAAVICISSFITTLTSWQFMAIAQQYFKSKDALAIYFGSFNLYSGMISLVFQVLLTTRFVRRFGIGTSLVLLPVTLLLGSTGLLVLGTLQAAMVLRGCDQVLRYSIDRSTTELLYLPLSSQIKLKVKWFIDTVIWRLGDAGAGFAVVIFATALKLPARQLSWVAIALVCIWIAAVNTARREYIVTLRHNITQHKIEADEISALVLDRSTTDLLAANISASDPKEILYALDLLQADKRSAHPAVRSLLGHPAPEVRSRAILILSDAGDKTVRPEIEQLIHDPDLNVRTNALLYLSHNAHVDPMELIQDLNDFEGFAVSSALVAYLARDGEAQNLDAARHILAAMAADAETGKERTREEVARLLGELPDCFDPLLANLIEDPRASVAMAGIRSARKLGKSKLAGELIRKIAHPLLGKEAVKTLATFGDAAIDPLRDTLENPAVPIEIRREIPGVLLTIGTPRAVEALVENLLQGDSLLRFSVIRALNKLHRLQPDMEIDAGLIETVLAAEILGHYRSYQILHTLHTPGNGDDGMESAMAESMQQETERIFRLLVLLYPRLDLHAVYMGLQSKNTSVCDNSLEFLDNVLKPQLRDMLVPLLDSKISLAEKARIANRLVRNEVSNREQAVAALVGSDDPWLRSCGAYAIGSLGITALEGELARCLEDADPLLREIARAAKARLQRSAAKA